MSKTTSEHVLSGPLEQQLAQAEASLVSIHERLAALRAQRPELVRRKMMGDAAAASEAEANAAAIDTFEELARDWREAVAGITAAITARDAGARTDEAQSRPRRIAELRRERLALARDIGEKTGAMAAAARAATANATELAGLIGDARVNGFFSLAAFASRLQSAAARDLTIDPAGPLSARNSLLGIAANQVGARAHWSLVDHELVALDDLAPFFVDADEATAAQARLAERGQRTIAVALPGDLWMLVRGERVFGSHEAAETAVAGDRQLAILPFGDGWIVVDDRYVGRAA